MFYIVGVVTESMPSVPKIDPACCVLSRGEFHYAQSYTEYGISSRQRQLIKCASGLRMKKWWQEQNNASVAFFAQNDS